MSVYVRAGASGGRVQGLAESHAFMRAVVSEDARVGLLLFDETSASLVLSPDGGARCVPLEMMGGRTDALQICLGGCVNKMKVFSWHRFGYLTRYTCLMCALFHFVSFASAHHCSV